MTNTVPSAPSIVFVFWYLFGYLPGCLGDVIIPSGETVVVVVVDVVDVVDVVGPAPLVHFTFIHSSLYSNLTKLIFRLSPYQAIGAPCFSAVPVGPELKPTIFTFCSFSHDAIIRAYNFFCDMFLFIQT